MLFKEMIVVYFENRIKLINTNAVIVKADWTYICHCALKG